MSDFEFHLTDREHQILCHLAWGGRTAGIAEKLYLSPDTVKFHIRAILRKLSARNRSHAVAIAFRTGVLGQADLPGWATSTAARV